MASQSSSASPVPPSPQPSRGVRKPLLLGIGGLALTLVAGYFGLNYQHHSGTPASTAHSAVTSSASSASSAGAVRSGASGVNSAGAVRSGASSVNSAGTPGTAGKTCALNSLPREAAKTVKDIRAGGPYDYPANDNKHFGNFEGILPREKGDYYREYTVVTPGARNRGERRIITGGGTEKDPQVWYYTDDHYQTFCTIPDAEK